MKIASPLSVVVGLAVAAAADRGLEYEGLCVTEEECEKASVEQDFGSFVSGDFSYARVYGCFSKNGVAYFGQGGTADQMAEDPLSGIKERIYGCDFELKENKKYYVEPDYHHEKPKNYHNYHHYEHGSDDWWHGGHGSDDWWYGGKGGKSGSYTDDWYGGKGGKSGGYGDDHGWSSEGGKSGHSVGHWGHNYKLFHDKYERQWDGDGYKSKSWKR